MGNKLGSCGILIVCLLIAFAALGVGVGEEDHEMNEERKPLEASLIERLTSLLYVSSPTSTSSFPPTLTNWDKLKLLINNAHAYFFPPNLEGSAGGDEGVSSSESEKVKGAVARTLEKCRVTMEDSAKSAAKIAGETLKNTKDKLRKGFSTGEPQPQHQQSDL